MTQSVIDDNVQECFTVSMDGAMAKLEYERDGERLLLLHTEVPEAFRGQGVGGRLVEAALAKAGASRLTIVPWCPYARRWLNEHPERTADVVIDFQTPLLTSSKGGHIHQLEAAQGGPPTSIDSSDEVGTVKRSRRAVQS